MLLALLQPAVHNISAKLRQSERCFNIQVPLENTLGGPYGSLTRTQRYQVSERMDSPEMPSLTATLFKENQKGILPPPNTFCNIPLAFLIQSNTTLRHDSSSWIYYSSLSVALLRQALHPVTVGVICQMPQQVKLRDRVYSADNKSWARI